MSSLNLGLSFYIIEMDEETYSLYNAKTDKNILFGVEREPVDSFLKINEPSHPFLLRENELEYSFTFNPVDMSGMPEYQSSYDSRIDTDINNDYSLYDPFYTDTSDGLQMNFTFIDETTETQIDTSDTDNILPFLPEEEQ